MTKQDAEALLVRIQCENPGKGRSLVPTHARGFGWVLQYPDGRIIVNQGHYEAMREQRVTLAGEPFIR